MRMADELEKNTKMKCVQRPGCANLIKSRLNNMLLRGKNSICWLSSSICWFAILSFHILLKLWTL